MLALLLDRQSYNFSIYSIATLVVTLAVLFLGCMVLARERLSPVSISFFAVTLAVGTWLFTMSMVYCSTDSSVALWWSRATYLGAPFISPAAYQFTVVM